MSKNPTVQEKMKSELTSYSITRETQLTLETVDQLEYVDCVLKETLRYAPIADATGRTVVAESDIIDGVKVQKGETILIAIQNIHRDPRYWNIDPQLFYPERFLNEDKNHHPYAFLPFGAGHRQCAGQDLARFELKIIVVRLMQFITFVDGGEIENSGGLSQRITCTPKNMAVYVKFDKD
ncbi:unnamed protein product [Didymodactylos carnosus]|uniref:Cytochrome P450 n=1 Tax=Didymodactylos carnosus TaxID=1234261 RepID=A0A815BPK2_9BILA|nr:unnamed protein product [Didymodactylos carnosus]CAF1456392.1 unnamed protein product [Didymodactylos carnosus]CAF4063169.1 unnamed protein product [Didymodactylos carnosus]CAF4250362.1 unnamed protein product [Didymodactylos carnosus]